MNQKALDFLETMVLEVMHKWPSTMEEAAKADNLEATVIRHLVGVRSAFVEWMMREPSWYSLIAKDLSMDANQVRDCYNDPNAFKEYCHAFLFKHFQVVLCDFNFEDEVTSILVRHKFIEADNDEPDR